MKPKKPVKNPVKNTKPKVVKKKVTKKAPTKRSRKSLPDLGLSYLDIDRICEQIFDYVDKNPDISLAYYSHDALALLVKKKTENVSRISNPNSMQPYESKTKETFYHSFLLEWGHPDFKKEVFGKLIEMGIPVYRIQIASDVKGAIERA